MPEAPTNPSVDELRQRLSHFSQWRYTHLTGDEKGQSQVFLDRLFQALGWPGVFEAGATLEYRVTNTAGGTSFADLLWKPRVLIEMKRAGTKLAYHLSQAFDYWVQAVPDRPRFVVLCNFDELWIYDFDYQLDAPVEMVNLRDLSSRWESLGFLLPSEVRPVWGNDLVGVTREAAAEVAKVYRSLKSRGIAATTVQRFTLQCVMAMFAEDTGLLPEHSFTKALDDALDGAGDAYDLLGGLFKEMDTPGRTPGGRFKGTPYFNGGLFRDPQPIELTLDELKLLRHAATTEWSQVRPEIFGTLFEGSMDSDERHASGAHFTSQVDIQRIVQPVIVQPWRDRINAASTIDQYNAILNDMSQFRVLDPAVGSGNFLYIAYRELRRLEREVIERVRERRTSQGLAMQESFGYITPEQFFGMDTNPFAVEVAKVTMLLGKKLADDELEEGGQTLPLDNLDRNIVHKDALFSDWPDVDAIIGNPPFLGRRKMRDELGPAYLAKLDEKFGPRGVSDFVTYWFPIAHDHLPDGGRAGFVGTKSIKQGDGRKVSLDYIVDNGGALIEAVSSMPWSGDASVVVSIVNWQKGGTLPAKRLLWIDTTEPPLELAEITTALSADVSVRGARKLAVSKAGAFQGQTNNVKDAFEPSSFEARQLIKAGEGAVIHPLLGGKVMLHSTSTNEWIIDIPTLDADIAWMTFPSTMKRLEQKALPVLSARAEEEKAANAPALAENPKARVATHKQDALKRWWVLWRRRAPYLDAIAGMPRYIAVNRAAARDRLPVFAFVDGRFHVNDSIVAFPFADDYSLGVLHSSVHEIWFRAKATTLGVAPRYNTNEMFPTFPWPQSPSQSEVDQVARTSAALVSHVGDSFRLGYSLAKQYDVLRNPGTSTLRRLKEELDGAVLQAYGFEGDEDVLTQLLELNLLVAQEEAAGHSVTGPGPQPTNVESSVWAWPAPSLA